MGNSHLVVWAGLGVATLVLVIAVLYNQRPYRRWEIKWGNFLLTLVFLEVGVATIFTGRITDSRDGYSVILTGAAAVGVGCMFLFCGAMLATAAARRRQPVEKGSAL